MLTTWMILFSHIPNGKYKSTFSSINRVSFRTTDFSVNTSNTTKRAIYLIELFR